MENVISVKRIFNIIDSCNSIDQLPACEKLSDLYIKILIRNGLQNPMSLRQTLYDRIKAKRNKL